MYQKRIYEYLELFTYVFTRCHALQKGLSASWDNSVAINSLATLL